MTSTIVYFSSAGDFSNESCQCLFVFESQQIAETRRTLAVECYSSQPGIGFLKVREIFGSFQDWIS
jgi:hypothetical protein